MRKQEEIEGIYYTEHGKSGLFKYFNREISWLIFNERVLQEAENPNVPLLERIRFLAIFSSNLDDFFRVRVASRRRLLQLPAKAIKQLFFNPNRTLELIQNRAIKQSKKFDQIYFGKILPALKEEKIHVLNEKQIGPLQREEVLDIFSSSIEPHLTPLMLTYGMTFPSLKDGSIYLAAQLESRNGNLEYALLRLPDTLPRFWKLATRSGVRYVIMLDDIIRIGLPLLFSFFRVEKVEAYTIKLTRDAELDLDLDIPESLLKKVNKSLKRRRKGDPVRFVYDRNLPEAFLRFLSKNLALKKYNLIPGGRYHNFSDFMGFPVYHKPHLYYQPLPPLKVPEIENYTRFFNLISKKDVLLNHPYHSYDYVVRFFKEAAIDPQVTEIKTCLYRLAKVSTIVNSLITAKMNGKVVKVIIELQARFDEEANIDWSERLIEAGVEVHFGVPNKKVHSKISLVTRIEDGKIRRYAHLATGNYNESTAKIYCDDSLFTSNQGITDEVEQVFSDLCLEKESNYPFKEILVAPNSMRTVFGRLIENEINLAKAGKSAYMTLKMNSLVDADMIRQLYKAHQAGVKITLIVRGICCLVPNVPGLSKGIKVYSIVDRYLEHSRIYIFGNGGDEKVILSSADWMTRNLSNRVEVAFPVNDPDLKKRLIEMVDIQLRDNTKSRRMTNPMHNTYNRKGRSKGLVRAQEESYYFLKAQLKFDERK